MQVSTRLAIHLRALKLFLVFVLVALSAPARAQQGAPAVAEFKPLTVERIWGQPSLSGQLTTGIAWSPDGKLLSYFHHTGEGAGARTDIWVLDVETGERRLLVDSDKLRELLPSAGAPGRGQQTGLGRVTPQQYSWSPNGDALLFIAQDHLYWFDLKSQTGRRLTPGAEPKAPAIQDAKISPDGRWVSFVRDYDLWVVNVATGEEKQLTRGGREELMNGQLDWVYPEELELHTAYWWSPDSSQIAFLQMDERPVTRYPLVDLLSYTGETQWMRYPKAGDANPLVRVGVVPVVGGGPRWMDTGRDTNVYIARVAWLRDSQRLAIQRLNRAQNKLELLFADAADGRSQVVLTEEDRYWVNLSDDLYLFADGRRFLWSSEREGPQGSGLPNPGGFRHLYLYDLSGKLLKQLTHGDWAVVSVEGADEKRGFVYFTATEKSPIERHLYRLALDGGAPVRVTREDGTHTIKLAPDAGHYLDTYSNALTPPRQDVFRAEGPEAPERRVVLNENKVAELAAYNMQPVAFLTVRGADGTSLHAMMIKPPNFDAARKYPVLVYLYGGPHDQVVRNHWGSATFLWHQLMAQKGFVIFALDNQGMGGRGHAFESPIYHHMSEAELADQLAGVAHLKSLPYVDAARIGIWGWSYGGYMTCTAMLNAADVFKAGFAGSPVTDWRLYDTIYTERYMGLPQENAEGYKQSSPVTHVGKLKGKLLIAAATGDDNVHFANAVEFSEKLIEAGRYAEIQIYPGRGHGITDPPARIHLFRRVSQFFLDNL
jgi:dipeptidyl-peptidase-4